MFFTRLISGIVLVLAAIFVFVQAKRIIVETNRQRFPELMNCCVYFRWKNLLWQW